MKKYTAFLVVLALVGVVAGKDRITTWASVARDTIQGSIDDRLPVETGFQKAHEELSRRHTKVDAAEYELAGLKDKIQICKKQRTETRRQEKTLSKAVSYGKELLHERRDEYSVGETTYSFGEFAALVKNEGALLSRTKLKLQNMDEAIANMEIASKDTKQAIDTTRNDLAQEESDIEIMQTVLGFEDLQNDIYQIATSVLGLSEGTSQGDKFLERAKKETFMKHQENTRMAEKLGSSRMASVSKILPNEMSDEEINAIGDL